MPIASIAHQKPLQTREKNARLGREIAAQNLIDIFQSKFDLAQGDEDMFVMDMPTIPLDSTAPIVLAQVATTSSNSQVSQVVGICQLIENTPGWPANEMRVANTIGPATSAQSYLSRFKHKHVSFPSQVVVLQAPNRGTLRYFDSNGESIYEYVPSSPSYAGRDRASFLVEIGGYKIKVMYIFHVLTDEPNTLWGQATHCGKRGTMWRITSTTTTPALDNANPQAR